MSNEAIFHCKIVNDDYLTVETTFDQGGLIGISTYERVQNEERPHHEVIIALDVDQTKQLIRVLQGAVRDAGAGSW